MRYDQFLIRLNSLGMTPHDFSRSTGLARNTVYGWKERGVPLWAGALLEMKETIEFLKAALVEFSHRANEMAVHSAELCTKLEDEK